jgi:hypothetical protein
MKKFLAVSVCTLLVGVMAAGCGIREKIEKKAGEAIGEKIVEEMAGDDVDVDIDGDKVVIKGEDGEELALGGTEWPDSGAIENIPKYKSGKVDSVIETKRSAQLEIIETDKEYFEEYIDSIKDEFDTEQYESNSSDNITYSGKNDDGVSVLFVFTLEDESCFITVSEPEKE